MIEIDDKIVSVDILTTDFLFSSVFTTSFARSSSMFAFASLGTS
jgi:hypothetical protein